MDRRPRVRARGGTRRARSRRFPRTTVASRAIAERRRRSHSAGERIGRRNAQIIGPQPFEYGASRDETRSPSSRGCTPASAGPATMADRGGTVRASRARTLRNGSRSRHPCKKKKFFFFFFFSRRGTRRTRARPRTPVEFCHSACEMGRNVERDGLTGPTGRRCQRRGNAIETIGHPAAAACGGREGRLRRRPWLCCRVGSSARAVETRAPMPPYSEKKTV